MTANELIELEKQERTGYLDIGNCGLTELPDLSELDWLETLVLSNSWTELESALVVNSQNNGKQNSFEAFPVECFPLGLKKLVLSNYEIGNWHFLEKLNHLTSLQLSFNQIRSGRFLEKLTNLTSLDLGYNQIRSGRFLAKLTNLTSLNLNDNKITDWGFLEKLTNLTSLTLSQNNIKDGHFLEKLTNLTSLGIWSNQISDGRFLEKLTNLTSLNLGGNQIRDGHFLETLTNLTLLYLWSNKISDWCFLETLTKLTSLNLGGNKISDGRFLEKLTNLTSLDLWRNKISDCRFLETLTNLTSLDLTENQISQAEPLKKLTGLTKIDLSKNRISDLSSLLFFIQEKDLQVVWKESYKETEDGEINLKNNPLKNPPTDIVKQGNVAILEYFRQKEKTGADLLLEAKLILLGDGRSGKTSLANRLLGKELPKEADRTQGVDIVIGEYAFPVAEGRQFRLHIWDFAGQDKYKPLHQFFYTEGAVYVMVADSGNAGTDYDDWLQTAELFGEGSPLLMALNEFREGIGYGVFDEEHWRKRFPKLLKEVRLVNLLTRQGFPQLEKDIRHLAESLPHTQVEYPKNWAAIRRELERRREENFISFGEYLKICRENDLPEKESALILSGVLHKIGVCLHYQKSEILRQHVILKNEWATGAVYKILEDRRVAEEKKGFFDGEDLKRIWSDEAECEMRPQLLELMQQFKMAYPLPNGKEYVAPPLLPPAPPAGWELPAVEGLELYLEYEFLPKALLTQFIVSRHTDIDRGRTLVWRNGVVLRWTSDTLAEVVKTKSQGRDAFQIRSQGSNRKGLLTAILKTFRDLHEEYKGIKASEIVPCPCKGCRTEKNKQHFFDFENLKNRLEKGRRTVECDKSLEEVELVKLLGDLFVFENLAVGQPVVMGKSDRVTRSHPVTEKRKKIQALVSDNDITGALEILEMELGSDDVILLKSQWSQFQRQDNLALRSSIETSPERNRIIAALLGLAEKF